MAVERLFCFLVVFISVVHSVRSASHLRLVNGLLIIEDDPAFDSASGKNKDLPAHGYLNRATRLRDHRNEDLILRIELAPNPFNRTDEDSVPDWSEDSVEEDSFEFSDEIVDGKRANSTHGQKRNRSRNSINTPAMDLITIIWYFSTFVALVAFFVIMACSDNYCSRQAQKPEEAPVPAPATPAPSYREFAPPSYDTVMKKYKDRIFIIPMLEDGVLKPADDLQQSTSSAGATASAPPVPSQSDNVVIVNENVTRSS